MTSSVAPLVDVLRTQIRHLPPVQRLGTVTAVAGLVIESDGPNVGLGSSDFEGRCIIVRMTLDFRLHFR